MSLTKVVTDGSQVKRKGLVMEGRKFPTVLVPNKLCLLIDKGLPNNSPRVLEHEGMFVLKSNSAWS